MFDPASSGMTKRLMVIELIIGNFSPGQERVKRSRLAMLKVTISATFSTDPIQKSIYFWGSILSLDLELILAPYGQIFQQLLSPQSSPTQNVQGINLILVCLEDWVCTRPEATGQMLTSSPRQLPLFPSKNILRLSNVVDEFIKVLKAATTQMPGFPYLIIFCPPVCEGIENPEQGCFADVFREKEQQIIEETEGINNLHFITRSEMQQHYPVKDYYDSFTDQSAHVPYTDEFFSVLGTVAMRKILSLQKSPYKVIVLDCDHTLWRGVCSEDGPKHISIEEPYCGLQLFMRQQSQSGMLLCLCSKNQEMDVLEVFAKRPDMPLALEQIVSWRINWQPKSENIKSLAQELNLALESFIFIDDSPIECAEVRANCPEVLTLQLPQDISTIPNFLQHIWAFDQRKSTAEDAKRTLQYQQNKKREQVREQTDSLENFLATLQLKIVIASMQGSEPGRVSQLTQRTNQFNFSAQIRTDGEIQRWAQQTGQHVLVVKVSDRFGDYGLVGAILYRVCEQILEVDTFLLSCRALGRGVEHRMLEHLGEIAQQRGLKKVQMTYRSTRKNRPAFDFLCRMARATHSYLPPELEDVNKADGTLVTFFADTLQELSLLVVKDTDQRLSESVVLNSTNQDTYSDEDTFSSKRILPDLSKVFISISEELNNAKKIQQRIAARKFPRPPLLQPYVAPRTKVERLLSSIWRDVLNLEQVGLNDGLAELGGDSLQVVQIHGRLSKIFSNLESLSTNVSIPQLFQYPTIRTLADYIEKGHEDELVFANSVKSRVAQQRAAIMRQRQRNGLHSYR